jgi:hypothetical protein
MHRVRHGALCDGRKTSQFHTPGVLLILQPQEATCLLWARQPMAECLNNYPGHLGAGATGNAAWFRLSGAFPVTAHVNTTFRSVASTTIFLLDPRHSALAFGAPSRAPDISAQLARHLFDGA